MSFPTPACALRARVLVPVLSLLAFLLSPGAGWAQDYHEHHDEHAEHDEHDHDEGLHFSHPLVTESVSPDTKVRLDYGFRNPTGINAHTVDVEGEYAFSRAFSVAVTLPYEFQQRDAGLSDGSGLGNAEVAFKFANYAFEDQGLLLGYGVELGLPTGNEAQGIGSNHEVELGPFLNAGLKRGGLETVAFTTFGIPTHLNATDEVETELEYNLSFLYHLGRFFQPLIEMDGTSILNSGEHEHRTVVNVTPGVKFLPLGTHQLAVGVGVGFPVTSESDFDTRVVASLFYHIE